MSDTVTLTTGEEDEIHGTFVAAGQYLAFAAGAAGDAWRAASPDQQKMALVSGRRFMDRLPWATGYTTFDDRDLVTDIVTASYELGAAICEDDSIVSDPAADNVASVSGGGVSLMFLQSSVAAGKLPTVFGQIIGKYLAAPATSAGYAATGTDTPAFGPDAEYSRTRPF